MPNSVTFPNMQETFGYNPLLEYEISQTPAPPPQTGWPLPSMEVPMSDLPEHDPPIRSTIAPEKVDSDEKRESAGVLPASNVEHY